MIKSKKKKTAKVVQTKKNVAVKKPTVSKKEIIKKKLGAKLKIVPFIEAAEKIINKLEGELFILTDEELVFLINEQLEPVDKIAERTFQLWKKRSLDNEKEEEIDKEKKELFENFLRIIKKAMIIEKQNLFEKLKTDKQAWQKWCWIIERKFSEWNLKHISEVDNKGSQLPTRIIIQTDDRKTICK